MSRTVIFDFDGVLADTEALHWEAFQQILQPAGLGITWEDYLAEFIGYDDRDALRVAHDRAGRDLGPEEMDRLIRSKAAVFVALAAARDDVVFPGAPELIHACDEAGWRLGICSGALREDIEAVLHGTELLDRFDVVVTAEDVTVSKPDPESYHQAVERLGVDPGQAVVIEDTPAGIIAARGAGLRVVGITTTHDVSALADADRVVAGLADLSPELLRGVLEAP